MWKIDYTEGVLGGTNKAVTTVLPPEDIRMRMNQPEQGNQDAQVYSRLEDIWSMSHERNDAAG
jgi:hypothetical protein